MVTPLITADQLAKAYGGTVLFEDATFQIFAGERVAIAGPNGAGKSTLLRILAGREKPDHGTLASQPVTTHWFDQHPTISSAATLGDLLAAERSVPPALAKEKAALDVRISDPALYEKPGYEAVLERYAELEQEINRARCCTRDDLGRHAKDLSGGQKTRIRLVKTLAHARAGDLIVLDEPTNHLDIESIEWLEDWLNAYQGSVLVVAHDRAFLDNVAQRVFEVRQRRIRGFVGNYEDYVKAREEDLDRLRRDHARAQKKFEDAKAVIQQFKQQKRFDGQYASRKKEMVKYAEALDRSPDPVLEKLGFGLAFETTHKSSNEIMRLSGITKSYAGQPVLKGLDFEVTTGDRIGLVGANGSGKTTLLNLVTGRIQKDAGTIRVAPGVKGKFLAQEHDTLNPERTLREEVLDVRPAFEDRDIKALLGRFHFNPDVDLLRYVKSLSGGERQRMMLLKAVLEPINLLILDEPTNHLDLWARDIVIHALNSFHGTLIVVSHDRFLLDATTDKTAILRDGQIHMYPGSFSQARSLHEARYEATSGGNVYRVRKKFTDWTTKTEYAAGAEVEIPQAALDASVSLRNAVRQGWLLPK
jgi:ATP-binding cassette, subfamily F, member 3